jgi:hypothetical protein
LTIHDAGSGEHKIAVFHEDGDVLPQSMVAMLAALGLAIDPPCLPVSWTEGSDYPW